MNISQRIIQIFELLNLSASEFADEIKVQRSSVSHITSGRNKPSLDFIQKLYYRFPEIQLQWLITGEGKPLKTTRNNSSNTSPTPSNIEPSDDINYTRIENNEKIEKIIIMYEDGKFTEHHRKI